MEEVVKSPKFLVWIFVVSASFMHAQTPLSTTTDSTSIRYNEFINSWNHPTKSESNNSIMFRGTFYNPSLLPIFCKMEHFIQKNSQIPVKIRLGDVEYVDKLESKE